jgi:helicase
MKFEELDIDERAIEILREQGIKKLYPPQEDSMGPALDGENLVLAIPTASGKSLVAYLAVVKAALRGRKALYIVPLRALASEKFRELKAFEPLGIKVGLTMGDYDVADRSLGKYDVIIATSEKADSLLRHRVSWLKELDVAVADEIHLINDHSRGPTLEVLLSKLKQVNSEAQVIALSATIRNSVEVAEWLEAKHISSEWRPVPLKQGIFLRHQVYFDDETVRHLTGETSSPIEALLDDVLSEGGQVLVFVNTRKSSESLAQRLSPVAKKHFSSEEQQMLKLVSNRIKAREDESTSMGARLSRCVLGGAAFHHAGLTYDQREVVEEAFKGRKLKLIAATPTLAAGINLPARMVIVRDVNRYDSNFGWVPIPVLEIKQMCGRAGRPKYDKEGEAVLLAKSEYDLELLKARYLDSEPERIESKLGAEPALRTHLLALIATGFAGSEEELFEFIGKTFFAHQNPVSMIRDMVFDVLAFLENEELIEISDGKYKATLFGKRVSDLYIDPLSGVTMRNALKPEITSPFGYLHAVCATPDISKLYMRRKDYEWVEQMTAFREKDFLLSSDDYEDYDFFLSEVKTASMIHDWIDEISENDITKKFDIGPGDIRNKVEIAKWLVYSMKELSKVFNPSHLRPLSETLVRIQKGVREELLDLVKLRGIGRVRARVLFDNGYVNLGKLRQADIKSLAKLRTIGDGVAKSIKKQLEGVQ